MSPRGPIDTRQAVPAATLAAFVGVVFFTILALLARPSGFSARLTRATSNVQSIEGLTQGGSGSAVFSANSVCSEPQAVAVEAFRHQLAAAAIQADVAVTNVTVRPGPTDQAAGGLAPVALQFEALGRYDAVLALLGAIGKQRPAVLVDTLDLKSQVSSVSLKLEGRFYCSTSARL